MSNSDITISLPQLVREGRRYWSSADGQAHWQAQRACLGPVCEALFGQHRLELSMGPTLCDMSPIQHALRWAPSRELAEQPETLVCLPSALPLPDACLQLVVVHHLLEIVPEPHHVLQEAARVTADGGELIIFGWDPLGVAGWSRWLPRRRAKLPWRGQWRTPGRLRDWLAFVDFAIERVDYCGFHLPGRLPRNATLETLGRRYNVPLGDSFMIRARRRDTPVQIQRPRLALGQPLGGTSLGHATRVGRHINRKAPLE